MVALHDWMIAVIDISFYARMLPILTILMALTDFVSVYVGSRLITSAALSYLWLMALKLGLYIGIAVTQRQIERCTDEDS